MLRFSGRFHANFRLKSGWIEPLRLGGHAPFSPSGATFIAGIDFFGHRRDDYYYILDNCPIAMKYTKRAKVIGNVFYDLDRDHMAVDIRERCCMLAYPYNINIRNLHTKMAHAPYFVSKTWQEKALKILKNEPLYEELPLN